MKQNKLYVITSATLNLQRLVIKLSCLFTPMLSSISVLAAGAEGLVRDKEELKDCVAGEDDCRVCA